MKKTETKTQTQEIIPAHPYEVGQSYFIRTVTMNYTGKLVRVTANELVFEKAAWIADTGARLSDFLKGSTTSSTEIEPFHGQVIVPRSSLIDATPWTAELPTSQK
jgi:hypothetical protein